MLEALVHEGAQEVHAGAEATHPVGDLLLFVKCALKAYFKMIASGLQGTSRRQGWSRDTSNREATPDVSP